MSLEMFGPRVYLVAAWVVASKASWGALAAGALVGARHGRRRSSVVLRLRWRLLQGRRGLLGVHGVERLLILF